MPFAPRRRIATPRTFNVNDGVPFEDVVDLVGRNLAHRIAVEIEARTTGGERTLILEPAGIDDQRVPALARRDQSGSDQVGVDANFQRPVRSPLVDHEAMGKRFRQDGDGALELLAAGSAIGDRLLRLAPFGRGLGYVVGKHRCASFVRAQRNCLRAA